MSNIQFAFLRKENVPTREKLQESIDLLGYDLQLDPEFTPFEDEGFSPCILNGKDDIGFEIFYEPSEDVTEDDAAFQEIVGDNDYCISMSWGGSFGDCSCAMIVSLALAEDFGAIISYEGDEPEPIESLREELKEALREFEKEF
ncbi:hypothetical protein [Kaarinaea lacus]